MRFARTLTAVTLVASLGMIAVASPGYAYSSRYCRDYAHRVANHEANGGNVLLGTGIGALGGLAVGSIIGGSHAGAIGAFAGGATGLAISGSKANKKWHRSYNRAYDYCINR